MPPPASWLEDIRHFFQKCPSSEMTDLTHIARTRNLHSSIVETLIRLHRIASLLDLLIDAVSFSAGRPSPPATAMRQHATAG